MNTNINQPPQVLGGMLKEMQYAGTQCFDTRITTPHHLQVQLTPAVEINKDGISQSHFSTL